MKLYHCKGSRSTRVLWLLEELGLEYELETLAFDPKALRSADYLALSPFGKVPVLVDGSITMFESLAIMQYLLEHYGDGRLRPTHESPNYGHFLQWFHFGESTLMPPVARIFEHTIKLPEGERDPRVAESSKRQFQHFAKGLETALAGRDYLVGNEFTAADIVVGYTLNAGKQLGVFPEGCPALEAYLERLTSRPAFRKAVAT